MAERRVPGAATLSPPRGKGGGGRSGAGNELRAESKTWAARPQQEQQRCARQTLSVITSRTHSSRIGVPQLPDEQASKVDRPLASPLWFQSHWITDEGLPHEPLAALPFDLPIGANPARGPTLSIDQHRTAPQPCFGTIHLRGCPLPQGFVRPNPIVSLYPPVQAPLLRSQMARGRPRRLGLEHAVHLLVRPVLFGMSRRDEFDSNAQGGPPGAQPRQTPGTSGPKRPAVVRANHGWIAVLPEQPQKDPARWHPTLILEQPDRQQIPTERIPDRQGLHPLAVASSKPAFEIHRPHLIAAPRHGQPSPLQSRPPRRMPTRTTAQFHSPQPFANRPRTRHAFSGVFLPQTRSQFPAAPTPVTSPQTPNPDQPSRGYPPRRTMRATGPVPQTARPLLLESRYPLVAALAAQTKTPTQLRHALLGFEGQLHELQPLYHRRKFFPRHARGKAQK